MLDAKKVNTLRAAAVAARDAGWEIKVDPSDLIALIDNLARLAKAVGGKLEDHGHAERVGDIADVRGLSRCRSCSKPIIWAKTESGKPMPVDAAPAASGNIDLRDGPNGLVAAVVSVASISTAPRYLSHFATCPNAAAHRNRNRKGGS